MPTRLLKTLAVAALCALAPFPRAAAAQSGCPAAANPRADAGWARYRAGDVAAARREFDAALARCPAHPDARTGLGYVALREGDAAAARRSFDAVLAQAPGNVDALVGRGLAAWRQGDLATVRSAFTRVRELDPGNTEARDYLARLPEGIGPAPARPPLVLPDTVVYPARARGDRFEVRTARGWEPFYVKGVNLGAALPGKHPSEFPDSATYARWIGQMAEMGANSVRLYTIHPPHFYRALRGWNLAHPDAPLWVIHGVWTELPPEDDFDHPEWRGSFFAEMRRVVDLLHGRAATPCFGVFAVCRIDPAPSGPQPAGGGASPPLVGDLLRPALAKVSTLVRSTQERVDGMGYPDRLMDEDIPLGSRIIGVCAAYVAMTSELPYRAARSPRRLSPSFAAAPAASSTRMWSRRSSRYASTTRPTSPASPRRRP